MNKSGLILMAASLAAVVGCKKSGGEATTPAPIETTTDGVKTNLEGTKSVKVQLNALGDSGVSGTLVLTQTATGVSIIGGVAGLTGVHAFHIHENGDCSAPDGSSAGGHFNPHGHDHGAPTGAVKHLGDLGNLNAQVNASEGVVPVDIEVAGASLTSGEGNLIGRSFIIHAGEDDFVTQPTGNAGGRIACGVISE